MGKFNSDDHYIYYCGQEFPKRNGVTLIVNKRVQSAVVELSQKEQSDLGSFPRHTIQHHSNPTSDVEEAEVEWFFEDLQDLLELTPKKKSFSLQRN